jgi:predicted NodU family carbamoyl transferase
VKIISIHVGHNATVGLTIDGLLTSVIHEERITRKKNFTGFPLAALKFTITKYLNNSLHNVDKVIFTDKTSLAQNISLTQSFNNTLEINTSIFDYAYTKKKNILRYYFFFIFFKQLKLIFILNFLTKFKSKIKELLNSCDYKKKKILKKCIKNTFRY